MNIKKFLAHFSQKLDECLAVLWNIQTLKLRPLKNGQAYFEINSSVFKALISSK
jgi:hypothetical protein